MASRSYCEFSARCRVVESVPVESSLVCPAIAHTGSRRSRQSRRTQSRPLKRPKQSGAIFSRRDVTQPEFEEKIKAILPCRVNNTVVILNPAAGNEEANHWQERVESIARGCPVRITSQSGEAEALARRAVEEGFEKIVAAGGDGTVNQVVNGLAGSSVTLGLLPIGTMNVFATELGLPVHDLEFCWSIVKSNSTRSVDLPKANQKFFVQLAGVGLDAQVVKETSSQLKRNFGPLSYLISAAQIAARQPPRLSIQSEDASIEEGSFVLVGNGRLYGGPFPFFKHAVIDDGLLDVIVFKRLGYLEIIKYLQDVVFSSEIRVPEIEYFQTRRLRVTSDSEVPVELDGELVGSCPVEIQVRERMLRVLTPVPQS